MMDLKKPDKKDDQKDPKEHRMMDDEGSWNYTPPQKKEEDKSESKQQS